MCSIELHSRTASFSPVIFDFSLYWVASANCEGSRALVERFKKATGWTKIAQEKDTEFILPEYIQKRKPAKRLFIENGAAQDEPQTAKRLRRYSDAEADVPGPSGLNQPAAPAVAAEVTEPEWRVSATFVICLPLLRCERAMQRILICRSNTKASWHLRSTSHRTLKTSSKMCFLLSVATSLSAWRTSSAVAQSAWRLAGMLLSHCALCWAMPTNSRIC